MLPVRSGAVRNGTNADIDATEPSVRTGRRRPCPTRHAVVAGPTPGRPAQGHGHMPGTMDRITLPEHATACDGPPAADRLAAAMRSGTSASVTSSSSTAPLLAALARLLDHTRTRVLHVRPPLDLPCFMDQVAGTSTALADSWLERGFNALTLPGAECDRIALLVEDAHQLPPATLRYIELVLRARPPLQVVLAGRPGIADTLALDGFAGLRRSIPLHLALTDAELPHTAPTPAMPPPERYRMTPLRLMVGAAAAAGMAVLAVASLVPPRPADAIAAAAVMLPSAPATADAQAAGTAAPPQQASPDQGPIAASVQFEADAAVPPVPVIEAALAFPPPKRLELAVPPDEPVPQARAAVHRASPAPPRAQPRLPVRPERVASYPLATGGDGQRCRALVLRLQLGESSTDGDRTYLRNGCR